MNYIVSKRIDKIARTRDIYDQYIETRYCIETIIILYGCLFYTETRAKKMVKKNLVQLIQFEFQKRSPLLSSWVKLLDYSLKLLGKEIPNFPNKMGIQLQELANHFLPLESKKGINKSPSLREVLSAYLTIRNKGLAHTTSITKETFKLFEEKGFFDFPDKLSLFIDELFEGQLIKSKDITKDLENKNKSYSFLNLSSPNLSKLIINNKDLDDDELYSNQIYCYFEKNRILVPTAPFVLFKNESYLVLADLDKEGHPIYEDIFGVNERETIKIQKSNFEELIAKDLGLLTPELKYRLREENGVFHNLPKPSYSRFIGRSQTKEKIRKTLNHRRFFLITLSGIGGVGKSAIAVDSVNDLIKEERDEKFNFIIWVSAKITYLESGGIRESEQTFSNLNQLLDLVLKITGFHEFLNFNYDKKRESCLEILSLDKFLLIVDNFETIPNPNEFLTFFEDIGDYSEDSKILLTTRHQLGTSEKVIDLREFHKDEYSEFVKYLYTEKFGNTGHLKESDITLLYELTGGLPLASEFFIGQCSEERPLSIIIENTKKGFISNESILEFSFKESFVLLGNKEKSILFAIALLESPNLENISFVSDIEELDTEELVSKLIKLSFINENKSSEEINFTILPLTKEFLLSEIEKDVDINKKLRAKLEEYNFIISSKNSFHDYDLNFSLYNKEKNLANLFAQAALSGAKNGEFDKSERYFRKALEYNSRESAVWYFRAIAERDYSNNIEKNYFEKAIKFSKTTSEKYNIMFEYGKTLFNNEDYHECVTELNKLVEKEDNKNAYHTLGKAHYQLGKMCFFDRYKSKMDEEYEKSMNAFTKSFFTNPLVQYEKNLNTIGYYFIAKISFYQNNFFDAIDYLRQGLELQPNNWKLLSFKEEIEAKMKRSRSKWW